MSKLSNLRKAFSVVNDCTWCNKLLRGKKSSFYSLCSVCRNSPEGKDYVNKLHSEHGSAFNPTNEEDSNGKRND